MNNRVRLASVDALRGITVAAMLLANDAGDWNHIYAPFEHAEWNGATPTDLIFPFFLFLVGVGTALGIVSRLETGGVRAALSRTVLIRALRIVVLGLVLHAIAFWLMDKPHFRPFGVLQRIGICFGVAGLIAIYTQARTQWLIIWGILVGYWALMWWGGPLTKEGNLASHVDTWLLGPLCYQFDPATGLGHDPEGLLSTIPAIATTLIGVRAGEWLRSGNIQRLWAIGTYAILLGFLWSLVFPINKNLWTSSYAVWTAGWAMLMLALAHELIDKRGAPALGRRFGVNAIAAYAGAWMMAVVLEGFHLDKPIYTHGFEWIIPYAGPKASSLAYAVTFVFVWWVIVWALDRRKIYFKI